MKIKTLILLILALLVACAPITATPATNTEVVPTGYPAPVIETAAPPTATPEPTATSAPAEVWEIWFSGGSCKDWSDCNPAPGFPSKMYSVKSDGSELTELTITDFPSIPALPNGVEPVVFPPPLVSPDGKAIAYFSGDYGKLYIANTKTGDVITTFTAFRSNASIRGYCWLSNSSGLKLFEIGREQNPIVYVADITKSSATKLFEMPENPMIRIQFAICSPNGMEMAISILDSFPKEKSGLYILNLGTGDLRQIVFDFQIFPIRVSPEN